MLCWRKRIWPLPPWLMRKDELSTLHLRMTSSRRGVTRSAPGKAVTAHTSVPKNCTETRTAVMTSCDLGLM